MGVKETKTKEHIKYTMGTKEEANNHTSKCQAEFMKGYCRSDH